MCVPWIAYSCCAWLRSELPPVLLEVVNVYENRRQQHTMFSRCLAVECTRCSRLGPLQPEAHICILSSCPGQAANDISMARQRSPTCTPQPASTVFFHRPLDRLLAICFHPAGAGSDEARPSAVPHTGGCVIRAGGRKNR